MARSTDVSVINFYGDELVAVSNEKGQFVALKPICEYFGLGWGSQYNRIQRDKILSQGVFMMKILGQEMTYLNVKMINGWLFTIEDSRIKDEKVREKVLKYKLECYDVLHDYFAGKSKDHVLAKVENGNVFIDFGGMSIPLTEFNSKLRAVDVARQTWGIAKARQIWVELDLPKGGADKYLSPQLELIND